MDDGEVVGKYSPEHLYFTDRREMQEEMSETINAKMEKEGYFIYFDQGSVLVSGIDLPARIDSAIQEKLEQEQ